MKMQLKKHGFQLHLLFSITLTTDYFTQWIKIFKIWFIGKKMRMPK